MTRSLFATILAASALSVAPVHATVLYDPQGQNQIPPDIVGSNRSGDITWYNDSTVGRCYRFRVVDKSSGNSERIELRAGGTLANNTTRYVGWRSRLVLTQPTSTSWRNVFQSKTNADSSEGYLVIMRADSGTLRLVSYDGGPKTVWSRSIPLNTWFSIVLRIKYSTSSTGGEIQLWYNGSRQTLRNGATLWKARTWSGTSGGVQMGIYRSISIEGTEYNYIWRPRVGTSYSDVAP